MASRAATMNWLNDVWLWILLFIPLPLVSCEFWFGNLSAFVMVEMVEMVDYGVVQGIRCSRTSRCCIRA
jgi:hypothetical protein